MLPQANYENSCKVCERLLKAFERQYPHSPVDIKYSVQPLEPMSADREPVMPGVFSAGTERSRLFYVRVNWASSTA